MSETQVNGVEFFQSAMAEMGIDQSRLDEDSLELGDVEAEANVETAATEDVAKEESDLDIESEEAPAAQENGEEENKEAPAKEPKLTLKEFQEIEQAKVALENERKAFHEEMEKSKTEFAQQYAEKIKDYDQMDEFLNYYAEKDPDMFALIQQDFKEFTKQTAHPMVEKFNQKVSELEQKLAKYETKASNEVTITKLNSELNEVKNSLGKEIEASGIKVDWNKVEDVWAAGEKGNLSVKNALYAVYGEQIAKAMASKAKVAAVESKIKARPVVANIGTIQKSNAPVAKDYSKMSILDVLKEEARALKRA
jgi:succinate dehydrogenase flavin-adding protein (antitoxin of CptAB toxin-antitoxin module)